MEQGLKLVIFLVATCDFRPHVVRRECCNSGRQSTLYVMVSTENPPFGLEIRRRSGRREIVKIKL